MSINDGEPAFPIRGDVTTWEASGGMSLRDYFAGQALIMAAVIVADRGGLAGVAPSAIAEAAYLVADAMLAQRAKE